MYGGASLKAKRYSALESTWNKLNFIFSHLWRKKLKNRCCLNRKLKKIYKFALYLLALSQELPCFSEKEEISVTPMYRWAYMNVLLWMYTRVSDFVCAYHLHYIVMAYLFLRRKKNIKAIQIS